eukprot:TRINITY_DN17149_c0_g2_i1.p1 TRINITY_DN17149_c0_g2~~TRINITY_DN17149_c0_g2_i1.p1  ORF type:complete len:649 (-),score=137.19 TRINITY_DN17149_c0_g2_i1:69-1973(-)
MAAADDAAESALTRLCRSAESQGGTAAEEAALGLLGKIFQNVQDHPSEAKYRKLNLEGTKLRGTLLCHEGASDFLSASGFVRASDGSLELPVGAGAEGARAVAHRRKVLELRRGASQVAEGEARLRAAYAAALQGGAHGAGHKELEAARSAPGGQEALDLVQRILLNVRRYSDNEKYRRVSLAKLSAKGALPAVPLLEVAGFVRAAAAEGGEEELRLERPNGDVLERVWAMVYWATRPQPQHSGAALSAAASDGRALASVLGAAIGDALGAALGGQAPYEVSATEVDKAMEMCGGGTWGVAPGQVTGNTELALCLATSLAASQPLSGAHAGRPVFPADDAAARYGNWGRSMPFRGERASMQAFQRPLPAELMIERAKDSNQKSMGCGALVRCSPLVALAALPRGSPALAAHFAEEDARLSHPDATVGAVSAAYVVAAGALVNSGGDRQKALAELRTWLQQQQEAAKSAAAGIAGTGAPGGWSHLTRGEQPRMGQRTEESRSWAPPGERLVALEVVSKWAAEALREGGEEIPFSSSEPVALLHNEVGTVELPFKHALRFLARGCSFEEAMRGCLAAGGDACTTAAVVGGLLGAAVGLEGLPSRWVEAVMRCETSAGQTRPVEYHPKEFPALLAKF